MEEYTRKMKIKKLEIGIAKGMVEIGDDSVLSPYASINGDWDFSGYGEIDGKLWRFNRGYGEYVGKVDELSKLFSPNSKRYDLDRRKTEALEKQAEAAETAKHYIENAVLNVPGILSEEDVRRIVKEEIEKPFQLTKATENALGVITCTELGTHYRTD